MTPPPFLLLLCCVLWGWQTGLWLPAACCALVAEGWRMVSWRREFTPAQENRLWTWSILLMAAVVTVMMVRSFNNTGLVRLLPLGFIPLLAVQLYGTHDRLTVSPFKLVFGRTIPPGTFTLSVDVRWVFALVVLVAAGAQNGRSPWFFPAAALLAAYAFLSQPRPPGRALRAGTATALLLSAASGFGIQLGLHNAQPLVEDMVTQWELLDQRGFDPSQSITSIGSLRTIKLSPRLVHRVELPPDQPPPAALLQATYTTYRNGAWSATRAEFAERMPEPDFTTWTLGLPGPDPLSMRITSRDASNRKLLLQPPGLRRLTDLPADRLEESSLGTLRASGLGSVWRYGITYDSGHNRLAPPGPEDLAVPPNEVQALEKVLPLGSVSSLPPAERLRRVEQILCQGFTYSTVNSPLASPASGQTALADLLLHKKSGHCEYYATATVLLLRRAGIPARYAVGYAVTERQGRSDVFLLRDKHAHAWVLAHLDGRWTAVDTTPSTWVDQEVVPVGLTDRLADLWNSFRFTLVRWIQDGVLLRMLQVVGIVAASAAFRALWQMFRSGRRSATSPAVTVLADAAGSDSPFYRIEAVMASRFSPRAPGQSLRDWLLALHASGNLDTALLRQVLEMLPLHYTLRFGSPCADTAFTLQEKVDALLASMPHISPPRNGLP